MILKQKKVFVLFLGKRKEYVAPFRGNPRKWEVVKDGWACKRGELVRSRKPVRIQKAAERITSSRTRITPLDLLVVQPTPRSGETVYSVVRGSFGAIVPWMRLFPGGKGRPGSP